MTTARELMSTDCAFVTADATLADIAGMMRDQGVGAVPVCDTSTHLDGLVTDRDIVVRCVAEGLDPSAVRAADLTSGAAITVDAGDDAGHALSMMTRYGVRRLPVVDEGRLVGMLAQADVARSLPPERAGALVSAISATPADN